MLCNGSSRPGPPGRRAKWLADFYRKGLTPSPLSLWRFHLLGLGIVFCNILEYSTTFCANVNGFLQKCRNLQIKPTDRSKFRLDSNQLKPIVYLLDLKLQILDLIILLIRKLIALFLRKLNIDFFTFDLLIKCFLLFKAE